MSPRSRSLRTFLPLFAAALFVGSVSAFAFYQSNDSDGSDDASFSLPNPPVLAKFSNDFFGQTLLGALTPDSSIALPITVNFDSFFHATFPAIALSSRSNDRGPPARLS